MLELIGLLVGMAAGLLFPWSIPSQWSLYVAAGLLAALDSALGGFRSRLKGEFKLEIFLSGTLGNAGSASGAAPLFGRRSGLWNENVPKLCGNPPGTIDLQAKER